MPKIDSEKYMSRFRLPYRLEREQMGAMEWRASRLILRSVQGGPTSYGTVGNDPVLLSGMDRWDAWLREAAQDNTSYLNASNDHEHEYLNRPASHRGLLDTPRFGGAALRDKDPLMVLVEDAVAQVQSQCPFRVHLRPVPHSTSNSPRDACLYFMADRKLCVRLENGIAMCLFATHTEPLKEYLENLYSVFTTMPAEAILLRREMLADANGAALNEDEKVSNLDNDPYDFTRSGKASGGSEY